MATGQCLCGAIRYRVHGPLRDAVICHCIDCRRWHGSSPAMVAAPRESVEIIGDEPAWYTSAGKPRRGFCGRCGSSLFWDAQERPSLTIAAGTLDTPTGLRTKARIFTAHASDYELIPDDGLPQHPYQAPPDVVTTP
ncbi:MAG: GFA family protein [Actinophytocola sp.]|nr:GFA family protein [Actinophytocola sp.]